MYHCDTFDMSLPWRRLWKLKGSTRRATADVVGREGVGWRALLTATADWGGSWLRPPRFSWARKHATHATRATQAACTTYFIYDKKGRASEGDGYWTGLGW